MKANMQYFGATKIDRNEYQILHWSENGSTMDELRNVSDSSPIEVNPFKVSQKGGVDNGLYNLLKESNSAHAAAMYEDCDGVFMVWANPVDGRISVEDMGRRFKGNRQGDRWEISTLDFLKEIIERETLAGRFSGMWARFVFLMKEKTDVRCLADDVWLPERRRA
jgi:hypothetical protein